MSTMTLSQTATPVLSVDEVLPAVRAVRAVVEANADAAERDRTLPRATVDALVGGGLLALRVPAGLGGSEVVPLVALAAYEEMTAYDTSAGWIMAIANGGTALAGARMGDDAAAEVFRHRVPLMAGSFAPTGTATPVPGGYRVSGRWAFASGIRHAEWVTGGCLVAPASSVSGGPPEMLTVVAPRHAVTVVDNWHVAGLRGTGSCDWEVSDLFVPVEYTARPLGPPRRGGPTFALPPFAFLAAEHAGFALGCARRCLVDVTAEAGKKVRLLAPGSVASRSAFQRDLGRAEAALRAARLLVVDVLGAASETAWRGDPVTPLMAAEARMAATHATEVAVDICTLAFRALGAHAVHASSPTQRYFRDIHAAAQHAFVTDTTFEDVARMRLGLQD